MGTDGERGGSMTEYEIRYEKARLEKYTNQEVVDTVETVDVPDDAIGIDTTAITGNPIIAAVTYLVPVGDEE